MTKVRLRPDLNSVVEGMPGVQEACFGVASGPLLSAAKARAEAHRDTGEYISKLVPEKRDNGAALVANAHYANFVEWGTCSRRLPEAPTPCPHPEPKKTGVRPQLIMTGAMMDVAR